MDTIPSSTQTNVYQSGWTRQRYTNAKNEVVVETITEQGVSHNLQVLQEEALAFLNLDKPATGLRPGRVLKKGAFPNTAVISSSNTTDHITITVRSVPGHASFSLFTVNGALAYSLSHAYSSNGIYTFVIRKNISVQSLRASNMYIMKLSLNGAEAGAFRFIL